MYLPRQPSSIYTPYDDTLGPLALVSQAPTTSSSGFMSKAKQWWKSKAWTSKPKITSKLLNTLTIGNTQFNKKWGHLSSDMSPEDPLCSPTHISFGENFLKNPARKWRKKKNTILRSYVNLLTLLLAKSFLDELCFLRLRFASSIFVLCFRSTFLVSHSPYLACYCSLYFVIRV